MAKYPTTPMCDGELLERFEPTTRDTDVFVSTSAKCGQTWLQCLLFHLKTKGLEPDMRGIGLTGVSPWLEIPRGKGFGTTATTLEERLGEIEAVDDPRVFKLHVIWEEIPRPASSKAKIMTISRDPRDVPYSMFAHLQAMDIPDGPPDDFDAYFEQWMEFGFYYKFLASFWPHRKDPDVLWLRYEQMKTDLRGQTQRIVDFLGWPVTEEDIDRVLPLVEFSSLQKKEKSEIIKDVNSRWKKDKQFFREGAMGKNRARLNPAQEKRIVDRLRAEFSQEACDFVLSLGD